MMNEFAQWDRRGLLAGASAAIGLGLAPPLVAKVPARARARYRLTLVTRDPLRFAVAADLPLAGDRLDMASTYPAELPAMASKGWPALIGDLTVTDAIGRPVPTTPQGAAGWRLDRPLDRANLRYRVDFSVFQAAGWSSPLESAVTDAEHIAVACRGLFITTRAMDGADVTFAGPRGWRVVPPWPASDLSGRSFRAAGNADLTENMIVFSSRAPASVSAAGFHMAITAMGHWQPLLPLIRDSLSRIVALEVGMMAYRQREQYNVILMPTADTGGEAYRQSFAYCFANPTAANRALWANALAHEFFHYWNASRLAGQDYAASQWFQEGFTEYVANLTLLVGRIAPADNFLSKLSTHVANYGRLATTLENIGTHKGPPLYSAGALVAFSFDAMIRYATAGRRTIGTFFRHLWRLTGEGRREYAWAEIESALNATVPGRWNDYYSRYIRGHEKLPLDQAFRLAGLKLTNAAVVIDPDARAEAGAVWASLNSTM